MRNITSRQLGQYLLDDEIVGRKMIFISGPRQVGKTTFIKSFLEKLAGGEYYNWDDLEVRRSYLRDPHFFTGKPGAGKERFVAFDEIHKRPRWKDILKGMYDTLPERHRILVTGSARLELFRRSGDSLIGRYVHFHLMPLSPYEILKKNVYDAIFMKEKDWVSPKDTLVKHLENSVETAGGREACSQLLRFSGFPEPFVRGSNRFLRKWSRDYLSLILREDLVELTRIRELDTAEKVVLLLPDRVGSPLSISSIARDVESSYPTVLNHINQLKKLWLLTGVRPWHSKINRAVHKEEKVYFLNWTYAAQESATFENFIAIVLIRACLVWSDLGFGQAEVYYIRNRDGIEIDFLVALNRKPAFLVETKLSDANISRASKSIADLLGVPLVQLVKTDGICIHHTNGAWSLSASRFLEFMP